MCIICISKKGIKQPDETTIITMFDRNPHGAGYMFARNGKVEIHKGFMDINEFLREIRSRKFTENDVVVYHFRISTQAGVNREMCHPFPLTTNIADTKELDLLASVGVAHNGIIPLTTNANDKEYSDTAHFIAEYMSEIIRKREDMKNPKLIEILGHLAESKLCLMDGDGFISTAGNFITESDGLIYSNGTYKPIRTYYRPKAYKSNFHRIESLFDYYNE